MKKKIMLYAQEGTGLGHLMRLIKIASGFSSNVEPLIVTGHQATAEVIFPNIKYFLLPSFYERMKAGVSKEKATKEQSDILWALIHKFQPDAFINDYLPLGKRREIEPIVSNYNCKKYFILRSYIGGYLLTHRDVFSKRNLFYLNKKYDRIFIASDKKISNGKEYSWLPVEIQKKMVYSGFTVMNVTDEEVEMTRKKYLPFGYKNWFVCSIGGGRIGSELLKDCIVLAKDKRFADDYFDVVLGNYNPLPKEIIGQYKSNNVRISNCINSLYLFHAAADSVICCGGYNTLLEAMKGKRKLVYSKSVRNDTIDDEQTTNIRMLSKYYDIYHINKTKHLNDYVWNSQCSYNQTLYETLDMNGIRNICSFIEKDLSFS